MGLRRRWRNTIPGADVPLFLEGQDPLAQAYGDPTRAPIAAPEPDPFAGPSTSQIIGAAFRRENPLVSMMTAWSEQAQNRAPDPLHNPFDIIKGTPSEEYGWQFIGSPNEATTRALMARIMREKEDERVLQQGGWAGTVASIAAGLTDPLYYLPIAGGVNMLRGGLRGAATLGGAGALMSGASEMALHQSQATRTAADSAHTIASNTILMGLMGGAIGHLSAPERKAAAESLDEARLRASSPGLSQSVGAAAADTRAMEQVGYGLDKVWTGESPNSRIYGGVSTVAKRTLGDMAETFRRFRQHGEGIPTAGGDLPPIESELRVVKNRMQVASHDIVQDAWKAHYYEGEAPRAAQLRADINAWRGQTPEGKMPYRDFKEAVYDALYSGDVHPDPHVQAAAQQLRNDVFDPVTKMAQETLGPDGKPMLGEALEPPKGDQSFAPRIWNSPAIIARRNEFHGKLRDWLAGEQATKAGIKDKIEVYQGSLEAAESRIKYLEAKIAKREDVIAELEPRMEEMRRLNKFAYQRAEGMRESQYRNDGGVRVDAPGKGLERARGGAVFETEVRNRGNTLADRAAGKQGELDQLSDWLRREKKHHDAMRAKIEEELGKWQGVSTDEVKAALKARTEAEALRKEKVDAGTYKGAGERLTSADDAVNSAVRRILASDRNLSAQELASRADEIIDRIVSTPDGRLPYDIASGGPRIGYTGGEKQQVRGSLNSRDFAIPTALVKDFVVRDIEHVVSSHLRTVLPDIMLTRRFGDVDLTNPIKGILEEYAGKIGELQAKIEKGEIDAAKAEKLSKKLHEARNSDLRDIAAVRDRLRGVYGWDPKNRNLGNIIRDFHNFTSIQSLGSVVPNSINDLGAQAVFRYGFMNVFNDAWRPFFKSMIGQSDLMKISKARAREMGVGVDGLLGFIRSNLHDINDNYMPGNKFSRFMSWANDRSMLINGQAPWTDFAQAMAWAPAQAEFGRTAERIAAGKATKADLARMADANISPQMVERIWKQYEQFHDVVDGVRVVDTTRWTDETARRAFETAMSREVNGVVLMAGVGDKPLFLSRPLGSLIGQFKSYTAAAHERVLVSNLQQRDGRTLQGIMTSVALGMLSYRLYTLGAGQQASERPQDWIKEGIDRASITGWLQEANKTLAKFTGGKLDVNRIYGADRPLTRRAENSPLSELLGPSYSKAEKAAQIVLHGFQTDKQGSSVFNAQDIGSLRQLVVPMQNLVGFRILLDHAEDGIANAWGIKPKDRTPKEYPR